MSRIGIFSGTFDPVHSGHIGFALQAVKEAKLEKIIFLPERKPRQKQGITHFRHRAEMLRIALKAHSKLEVLELPDQRFYPRTIARLNGLYPNDELFLLLGSDTIYGLGKWPHVELLLRRCGLVIGIRGADQRVTVGELVTALPRPPVKTFIFDSHSPDISSRLVRDALRHNHKTNGVLASVQKYAKQHWLYYVLEGRK